MSKLNQAPSSERVHISLFGRRNAGKSSLINALTSQEVSLVSDTPGTTTDPVAKAMELLPLGAVLIIDTPGIDDVGELGELRVKRTKRILNKTDVALLVVDSKIGFTDIERECKTLIKEKNIPMITVYNKCDAVKSSARGEDEICVSALTGENVHALREMIANIAVGDTARRRIIGDRLKDGDSVVLVTPIDASAPKGRLILPQVQTIRDILDSHAVPTMAQPEQLEAVLENMKTPPRLVITDSQVFGKVKDIVPQSVPLTSFSILMAAYKGILEGAVRGVLAIDRLQEGSRVLISEGCTHHRQCEDIGTVKLPAALRRHTGLGDIDFTFTSGGEFPEEPGAYDLIIHCGGCMLSEREMLYRAKCAADAGVPLTNYGTALAYMNGILKRSLQVFPELYEMIK